MGTDVLTPCELAQSQPTDAAPEGSVGVVGGGLSPSCSGSAREPSSLLRLLDVPGAPAYRIKNTFVETEEPDDSERIGLTLRRSKSDSDMSSSSTFVTSRSISSHSNTPSVGAEAPDLGAPSNHADMIYAHTSAVTALRHHLQDQANPNYDPGEDGHDEELSGHSEQPLVVDAYMEQIQRETGLSLEDILPLHEQGVLMQIPRNEEGNLTSVGSICHTENDKPTCSPCLFWFRTTCVKAIGCTFCHYPHNGQKHKRIRPSKDTRQRRRDEYANAAAADDAPQQCSQ